MDVHEQLRGLVDQMGPGVLEDADGLRGALDDYLDEDAASVGDINLMVDAVRLGAYRSFTTTVAAGATPAAALDEVGARLSRDRGSSDFAGSCWALAVLGFAAGTVGEADVRRYRSMHTSRSMPRQAAPPTPPASSTPPAASTPPADPTLIGTPPPQQSWQPPQPQQQSWGQPQAQQQPQQQQSWGQPQPASSGKRTGLIVAAVVAVLVVIGGGVGLALALGGDDEPKADPERTSATQDPTEDPTTDPTSDPTTEVPISTGVCEADSQGYVDALGNFSPKYSAGSERMLEGFNYDDLYKTQAGAYDMRAAVYDFDAEVRLLDLSAIQATVNELLTINGRMIAELDQAQELTTSQDIVSAVALLPSDEFTEAFTAVSTEITANPGDC